MQSPFIFIVFVLVFATECSAVIPDLFNRSTYHREFPPMALMNDTDGKISVLLSVEFINLLEVNEVMGEIEVSIFYRVSWQEPRLYTQPGPKYTLTRLPAKKFDELWRPDIVIENVRSISKNGIIKPTVYHAVFSPHMPFYSTYIVLRVGCPFEYGSYPMDIQVCNLHLGTMGLTDDVLKLDWFEKLGMKPQNKEQFLRFHHLFQLRICESTEAKLRYSEFGKHPQKTIRIILQRNFKSVIVQVFLPSVFFILIAWLSVLVPPTMLRTRLLLNCTNLLTIISMYLSISKTEAKRVPKVSYVTALNLWMFVTVSFCFSSVLLVILDIRLVVLLTNPGRKLETLMDFFRPANTPEPTVQLYLEEDDEGDEFADASDVTPELSGADLTDEQLRKRVAEKRAEWLSRTASFEEVYLVGYPVLFLLFVAVYFGFTLAQRDAKMASLMAASQSNDTLYPGCFCSWYDFGPGCMTEQEYIDNELV